MKDAGESSKGGEFPVLKFSTGGKKFAFRLSTVDGVFEGRSKHSLPRGENSALAGLVNINGELVILVDSAKLFGADAKVPEENRPLILWGGDGKRFALSVDSIDGIGSVNAVDLKGCPEASDSETENFAEKIFGGGESETVSLLDHELLNMAIEKRHL